MGLLEDARTYVVENKLRSIGILWASSLGASLAYQWSRPIPNSLKIIHSRVYAQALTLGSLAAVAVIEHYDHRHTTQQVPLLKLTLTYCYSVTSLVAILFVVLQELVKANSRLAQLERHFGFGEHGHESQKEAAAPAK